MQAEKKLCSLLTAASQANPRLRGWRFNLYYGESLEIGLKNNKIGGPYSAPSYKDSISGEIYLLWEGNHFTSASMTAGTLDNFETELALWEKTAYFDADGAELYQSEIPYPQLECDDEQIEQIIAADCRPAFQILTSGLEKLLENGITKVDANIHLNRTRRFLRDSQGLEFNSRATSLEFYFLGNDSYGKSYVEKRWFKPEEFRRIIDNTTETVKKLDKTPENTEFSGELPLILPPDVLERFLNHFLISNLYGNAVVNCRSCFDVSDFENKKSVLRDDLSLVIDTLRPGRAGSYVCTSEGVPGGYGEFITDGRLQMPILGLKYAQKMHLPPTPLPAGHNCFLRVSKPLPDFQTALKDIKRGLIVYSVLGMHTQDRSNSNFSLTADQCLLVEDGEIKGKVKAVINGNFLNSLCDSRTRFFTEDGEDNPGAIFIGNTHSL